jgi:hypothetical protein
MDFRSTEGSSFSLPTGSRTLPIAPVASAAPWMDSNPMEGGGYTVPTASSAKANPSPLPLWCGQEFPNREAVTYVYNDMLLNQYYLNMRYLSKPH